MTATVTPSVGSGQLRRADRAAVTPPRLRLVPCRACGRTIEVPLAQTPCGADEDALEAAGWRVLGYLVECGACGATPLATCERCERDTPHHRMATLGVCRSCAADIEREDQDADRCYSPSRWGQP